jgi:hypothetical protein
MDSVLKNMSRPDRATKRKATLNANFEAVIRESNDSLDSQFGPEARQESVKAIMEDLSGATVNAVAGRTFRRMEKLRERQALTVKGHELVSEAMARIVLSAAPLDEEAKSKFGKTILENSSSFFKSLFEDGTLKIADLSHNSSPVVRDFVAMALSEENCDAEEEKKNDDKVANIVTKKAKAAIKSEIAVAKKKQETDDELAGLAKAKADKKPVSEGLLPEINLQRAARQEAASPFARILRDTTRRTLKESGEQIDFDSALGEAAVGYCVLETLNTMNLLKDADAIISRLAS